MLPWCLLCRAYGTSFLTRLYTFMLEHISLKKQFSSWRDLLSCQAKVSKTAFEFSFNFCQWNKSPFSSLSFKSINSRKALCSSSSVLCSPPRSVLARPKLGLLWRRQFTLDAKLHLFNVMREKEREYKKRRLFSTVANSPPRCLLFCCSGGAWGGGLCLAAASPV